jgi:hypothetical protein
MTRMPLPSRLRLHGPLVHGGCEPCKLGYRVLPSASPSRHGRVFSPSDRWRLPWASSLSGDLIARLGKHFGLPPLTRLSIAPVARDDGSRAAEFRSTSGEPDHRWPDTPLRVFTPQRPWHGAASQTRAMCSPREPPHVAVRSSPALWVRPGLPELSGPLIGVDQAPFPFAEHGESAERESPCGDPCVPPVGLIRLQSIVCRPTCGTSGYPQRAPDSCFQIRLSFLDRPYSDPCESGSFSRVVSPLRSSFASPPGHPFQGSLSCQGFLPLRGISGGVH